MRAVGAADREKQRDARWLPQPPLPELRPAARCIANLNAGRHSKSQQQFQLVSGQACDESSLICAVRCRLQACSSCGSEPFTSRAAAAAAAPPSSSSPWRRQQQQQQRHQARRRRSLRPCQPGVATSWPGTRRSPTRRMRMSRRRRRRRSRCSSSSSSSSAPRHGRRCRRCPRLQRPSRPSRKSRCSRSCLSNVSGRAHTHAAQQPLGRARARTHAGTLQRRRRNAACSCREAAAGPRRRHSTRRRSPAARSPGSRRQAGDRKSVV